MWYFEKNGTQQGPESQEQVQQRLNNGEIAPTTLVWREGMAEWTPLSRVTEFQVSGQSAAPGAPPQMQQGPAGIAPPVVQNGNALTSMILGISSIVLMMGCGLGILLAVPAVILGHMGRKQIREGAHVQTGDGMALTGLIIGYLVIGLTLLGGVALAVAIILESP